ncbi:hypothetical protein HanRHA438_Chr03g0104401 [Helianthus annuus]|nr:hypothetical protein HanRHA438_Chr03g0104401 [Helianthus annuus]
MKADKVDGAPAWLHHNRVASPRYGPTFTQHPVTSYYYARKYYYMQNKIFIA